LQGNFLRLGFDTQKLILVPIVRCSIKRMRKVSIFRAAYQHGDELALRPEATASVCRAYIEHGMHALPQPVKLYYMGPMFRRERPQKGRYRQFYQIGAEVLEMVPPNQESREK